MKIKSVRIVNFRNFSGENYLELSSQDTKSLLKENPFVIVVGENFSGKSNLIEAVEWCLYGSKIVKEDCILNLRKAFQFRGKIVSQDVIVELVIESGEKNYFLKRSSSFMVNDKFEILKVNQFSEVSELNLNTRQLRHGNEDIFEKVVNRFFPLSMRNLIFISHKDDGFVSFKHGNQFNQDVLRYLNYDLLSNMIVHLNTINKKLYSYLPSEEQQTISEILQSNEIEENYRIDNKENLLFEDYKVRKNVRIKKYLLYVWYLKQYCVSQNIKKQQNLKNNIQSMMNSILQKLGLEKYFIQLDENLVPHVFGRTIDNFPINMYMIGDKLESLIMLLYSISLSVNSELPHRQLPLFLEDTFLHCIDLEKLEYLFQLVSKQQEQCIVFIDNKDLEWIKQLLKKNIFEIYMVCNDSDFESKIIPIL